MTSLLLFWTQLFDAATIVVFLFYVFVLGVTKLCSFFIDLYFFRYVLYWSFFVIILRFV